MATRFYLPASGAPAVTPPALPSGWTAGTTAKVDRPTSTVKANTAMADFLVGESLNVSTNIPVAAFVSAPLAAQSISGNVTAVVRCVESASAADASLQVGLYLISNDGTTVLSTLYAGHAAALNTTVGALGQEMGSVSQNTRIIPSTAFTTQSASAGDRLLILLGWRAHQVSTTPLSATLRLGDLTASADFALTSALTTDLDPWVELSGNLTFASNDLAPNKATQAQTATSPTMTQAANGDLAPSKATQVQTSTVPTLALANLIVAKATQLQTATSPTLALANLAPAKATQLQTADTVTLNQIFALTVAKATQLQTATSPTLTLANLAPAKATQLQKTTSPTLVQVLTLAPAKATQLQKATSPTLSLANLVPSKAVQLQTVAHVTLTTIQSGPPVLVAARLGNAGPAVATLAGPGRAAATLGSERPTVMTAPHLGAR